MTKPLNLIVACAENRVIGRAGRLPWHIPEDLLHFDELTRGRIVVLGRVGYESWSRAALDERQPVVITSRPLAELRTPAPPAGQPAGPPHPPHLARSVPEALAVTQSLSGEIMICGGRRIFEETLPLASRLYLTLIHADVPGDVYFPEWRHLAWRELERRASSDANYRYTFLTLERVR